MGKVASYVMRTVPAPPPVPAILGLRLDGGNIERWLWDSGGAFIEQLADSPSLPYTPKDDGGVYNVFTRSAFNPSEMLFATFEQGAAQDDVDPNGAGRCWVWNLTAGTAVHHELLPEPGVDSESGFVRRAICGNTNLGGIVIAYSYFDDGVDDRFRVMHFDGAGTATVIADFATSDQLVCYGITKTHVWARHATPGLYAVQLSNGTPVTGGTFDAGTFAQSPGRMVAIDSQRAYFPSDVLSDRPLYHLLGSPGTSLTAAVTETSGGAVNNFAGEWFPNIPSVNPDETKVAIGPFEANFVVKTMTFAPGSADHSTEAPTITLETPPGGIVPDLVEIMDLP